MKKVLDIIKIIIGLVGIIVIGVIIFIGTAMGTRADEIIIPTKDDSKAEIVKSDSIPQGKMTYELFFSEFGGRMENLPVEIIITGDKITVFNNKKIPLTGGEIIIEGILLKHWSGKWVIGESKSDKNAEEIGGCSGGPTPIDFNSKIIEWC